MQSCIPKDMHRLYLDAMALVRKYGKPDIFLTMTCNGEWPEIVEYLEFGQTAQDRPELVARIFKARLRQLKHEILKMHIFGHVIAHVYVVEFQKRGLPHVYMLLTLDKSAKLTTPASYDKFVPVELPNPETQPYMFSLVKKHMMHGPCGVLNKSNICMQENGQCRSKYPKAYQELQLWYMGNSERINLTADLCLAKGNRSIIPTMKPKIMDPLKEVAHKSKQETYLLVNCSVTVHDKQQDFSDIICDNCKAAVTALAGRKFRCNSCKKSAIAIPRHASTIVSGSSSKDKEVVEAPLAPSSEEKKAVEIALAQPGSFSGISGLDANFQTPDITSPKTSAPPEPDTEKMTTDSAPAGHGQTTKSLSLKDGVLLTPSLVTPEKEEAEKKTAVHGKMKRKLEQALAIDDDVSIDQIKSTSVREKTTIAKEMKLIPSHLIKKEKL